MNAPLPLNVIRDSSNAYDDVAKISNEVAGQLAKNLAAQTQGEVLFAPADKGRYATDASIYQVMPVGVFVPRTTEDVKTALTKFDAQPITLQQLAQHRGFTERQMYFLNIFQPSIFDRGWMLLNRDTIEEWFCGNEKSDSAVKNFYNRIIFVITKPYTYKPFIFIITTISRYSLFFNHSPIFSSSIIR